MPDKPKAEDLLDDIRSGGEIPALKRERDELRAEVERLQASNLASEIARANQRNDELLAEIEQLRAALEQYAEISNWVGPSQWRGPNAGWVLAQRTL